LFDYKEFRQEIILSEKAYFYQSIIHKKETTIFELRAIIVLVAGVRGTRQTNDVPARIAMQIERKIITSNVL
jgi:hypothetical protein